MQSDQTTFRYRNRAGAIRAIAGTTLNSATRRLLLEVADDYDNVAETLDRINATERMIDNRRSH